MKQEDGSEIEVFTEAEVNARVAEVETKKTEEMKVIADGYAAKETEAKTALQKLNDEKTALETKINGNGGGQVDNFKELKAALDKKTEEITALSKDLGEMKSNSIKDQKDSFVNKIAGKDAELKKKIDLFYEKDLSGMPDKTPEEIAKKVEAAAKLAGEVVDIDPLSGAINGAGGKGFSPEGGAGGAPEFSAKEKQLGAKMGITEADYKKYGPAVSKLK